MSEKFKVDEDELAKQMLENIYAGKYVELCMLVGVGQPNPIVHIDDNDATIVEFGLLYKTLDEVKKLIKSTYPHAVEYAKEINITGKTALKIKDED